MRNGGRSAAHYSPAKRATNDGVSRVPAHAGRLAFGKAACRKRTKVEAVLLPQPDGFEGFLAVVIHVHSAKLAGDELVDVSGGVLKRDAATGHDFELAKDQHAIAADGVHALHLDPKCCRRFLNSRKELPNALWASGRSFQGSCRVLISISGVHRDR